MQTGWDTVVVAATGPSFSLAQAEAICVARKAEVVRVLAVSDAFKMLPCADALYSCDGAWWKVNVGQARVIVPRAEYWTQDHTASEKYGLRYVKSQLKPGLSTDDTVINQGANSGAQALNLAYHFGARRLILVGFDCQRTDDKSHYFGDHPAPLARGHSYAQWIKQFGWLAKDFEEAGVEVANCTAETALQCFPLCDLDCILASL